MTFLELLPIAIASIASFVAGMVAGVVAGRWSSSLTDWIGWASWLIRRLWKWRVLSEADIESDPEYTAFVEGQRKHCHCSGRYSPCEGVLAGGMCDGLEDMESEY